MDKRYLFLLVALLLSGNIIAATWFGGYIDNQFTNASNWNFGSPYNADSIINQGHTVELTAPDPFYFVLSLKLGSANSNMNTLNMNGGLFFISNHLYVGGVGEVGDGRINMYSGEITCSLLYQGYTTYGEINLTDGHITVSNAHYMVAGGGGTALLNLDGGIMESDWLFMGAGAQIVIAEGTLKVNGNSGNPLLEIPNYIDQGWITAAPGYELQTEIINGGLGIQVTASFITCPVPPLSDANGDCQVDMADLAIMASEWLTCNLADQGSCWQ